MTAHINTGFFSDEISLYFSVKMKLNAINSNSMIVPTMKLMSDNKNQHNMNAVTTMEIIT